MTASVAGHGKCQVIVRFCARGAATPQRRMAVLRIVEETVEAITPHVLGCDAFEELPDPDPRASVEFLNRWTDRGIPEFRAVATLAFLALNVYSFLRTGRLFPRLDPDSQAHLLVRLYRAKGMLAYQFLYFLSTPAVNAYYSRIDVQLLLGFDVAALKEESERRLVTRDGGPLPPRDAAAAPPGEVAGR